MFLCIIQKHLRFLLLLLYLLVPSAGWKINNNKSAKLIVLNLQILFEIVRNFMINLHSVCFRSYFAAVIIGDTIIAIGRQTAEYLVLGERSWKELPKMHQERFGATACALP